MTTGEKIYNARKKAGMTQEELAEKLNVTRQAVSKWESDTAYPETDKIVELCKLFSISADELLLGAEAKDEPLKTESEKKFVFDREHLHFEYISKTRVGSLPLVHINFGLGHYRAKGIVALGNIATGVISLGFISLGLISLGLIALGALAFGVLALGLLLGAGAVAAGALALGGVAIGVLAFGGFCVGYIGVGGCAIGQYAIGGYAQGYIAVAQSTAHGAHAFVMPAQYEELCTYIDAHMNGALGEFIKSVARNLGA